MVHAPLTPARKTARHDLAKIAGVEVNHGNNLLKSCA
jgi:hypothetical protein